MAQAAPKQEEDVPTFQATKAAEREGPKFVIEGERRVVTKEGVTWEPETHEFTCLPVAPAGIINDMTTADGLPADVLTDFLEGCLVKEDEALFKELRYSKEFLVQAQTVSEIAIWLIGRYTGRPFLPPADSHGGPETTGTISPLSVASEAPKSY